MKKNRLSIWMLSVLVVLMTACTTTTKSEKVDEASNDIQNSRKDLDWTNKQYAKEVASYRASVETDLRNNKLRIAKLQDEKSNAKEEALIIRNERIAAVQKSNNELELRMRQYRGDNKEHWKEFRHEYDSDMSELGKSLKDLVKEDNAK